MEGILRRRLRRTLRRHRLRPRQNLLRHLRHRRTRPLQVARFHLDRICQGLQVLEGFVRKKDTCQKPMFCSYQVWRLGCQ